MFLNNYPWFTISIEHRLGINDFTKKAGKWPVLLGDGTIEEIDTALYANEKSLFFSTIRHSVNNAIIHLPPRHTTSNFIDCCRDAKQ